MANWYEYLGKVTIKVSTTEYAIHGANVRIVPVPYLGSGDSVIETIDGARQSRFTTEAWHFEITIEGEHTSAGNWDTIYDCVQDMVSNISGGSIHFSTKAPYDSSYQIQNVIPVMDGELISLIWNTKVRARKFKIVLKTRAAIADLPSWFNV